jgi:hypothetical protein
MIFDEGGLDRELMRSKVLSYLKERKFESVIDVGGASEPWAREFVSLYVDLWKPEDWLQRYPDNLEDGFVRKTPFIEGDLDDPVTWDEVLKFGNGKKFDFAICSHVIEHLSNPYITLMMLPEIAEEGYIALPSKYTELKRGGYIPQCRGALSHRWIGSLRNGEFWLFPKLSFIEGVEFKWAKIEGKHGELGFRWKNGIPFNIVTDKQLGGPNPGLVIDYYVMELEKGL